MVETYLKNTHCDTHSNYKMKLVNVFKIERENEEDNFRADLDNHRLLWHGKR
jgi:poly [ADP-ribose] polymerase